MKFNLNIDGKIECPICNSWHDLKMDHLGGSYHEFTCCGKSYLISINVENLERFKRGEKIKPLNNNWWLRNMSITHD